MLEAVAAKVDAEDAKARKEAEKAAWRSTKNKKNFSDLSQFQ